VSGDITPDLATVLVDQQQHGHTGLLFFAGLTPAQWSGGVVDGQFDHRCIGCRQHFLDCICVVEVMEVRFSPSAPPASIRARRL
jgi:hypothetical protein